MKKKYFIYIITAFILSTIGILFLKSNPTFNTNVLLGGNIFLFLVSVISYNLIHKNVDNANPRKFINGVMASTLFRLLLCIFAILGLLLIFKESLNKANIYILMLLYAVYMALDTVFTMKQSNPNS